MLNSSQDPEQLSPLSTTSNKYRIPPPLPAGQRPRVSRPSGGRHHRRKTHGRKTRGKRKTHGKRKTRRHR